MALCNLGAPSKRPKATATEQELQAWKDNAMTSANGDLSGTTWSAFPGYDDDITDDGEEVKEEDEDSDGEVSGFDTMSRKLLTRMVAMSPWSRENISLLHPNFGNQVMSILLMRCNERGKKRLKLQI
jgi:hypothetical protein